MVDNITGVSAYQQAAKITSGGNPAGSRAISFGDLVNQSVDNSIGVLKASEQVALSALAGQASLDELTTAVANAETTLRTIVSIRDRMIQAYQDILKMPI